MQRCKPGTDVPKSLAGSSSKYLVVQGTLTNVSGHQEQIHNLSRSSPLSSIKFTHQLDDIEHKGPSTRKAPAIKVPDPQITALKAGNCRTVRWIDD